MREAVAWADDEPIERKLCVKTALSIGLRGYRGVGLDRLCPQQGGSEYIGQRARQDGGDACGSGGNNTQLTALRMRLDGLEVVRKDPISEKGVGRLKDDALLGHRGYAQRIEPPAHNLRSKAGFECFPCCGPIKRRVLHRFHTFYTDTLQREMSGQLSRFRHAHGQAVESCTAKTSTTLFCQALDLVVKTALDTQPDKRFENYINFPSQAQAVSPCLFFRVFV